MSTRFMFLLLPLLFCAAHAGPQAPSPPKGFNYEEAKVPAYVLLKPLMTAEGKAVRNRAEWPARRAELLRAFEANVYGHTPEAAVRLPLRSGVVEQDTPAFEGLATRRQVEISLANGKDAPVMHLLLYLPAHSSRPVPVILGLNFQGNATVANDPGILATPVWQAGDHRGDLPVRVAFAADRRGTSAAEWQVEMLLRRGYGLATVYYGDIDPDYKDAFQLGIRPLYFASGQTQPKVDDWGAIGAWSWGLSRALEYLRTEPKIDAREIAVTGHSRLGKAADWAAAQDQRFAALLSTESGKGGQSLYHRELGETIEHLQHSFPYWFCGNFVQWVRRDREIPVDGNLLLALIAPRPLYVASAEQDLFSDPKGEFLAASDVGQVYALFGKQGLGTSEMPAVNQPILHDVAYHIRSGVHDVTSYDWEQYLTFLDRQFGSPLTSGGSRGDARFEMRDARDARSEMRDAIEPDAFPPLASRISPPASRISPLESRISHLAPHSGALQPESFHHYIQTFEKQELDATGKAPSDSWPWLRQQIPWFESSDQQFEEMYYFRWYAWQKHVVSTPVGWVITEWLPKPEMTDGFFGALPDAAPFHLSEARWLHDPKIAEDDAKYWFSPQGDPHKYSDAMAAAVRDVTLANGDAALGTTLLPAMEANYRAWETTQRDANGLFWSVDTRDAMEKSISGDGYRPTLNSYMFGDAVAIARTAGEAGDAATEHEFEGKAQTIRALIEQYLWNPKDQFYEVMSPAKDSGIRAQKRFIDPGTTMQTAGVRELIGYTPWLFEEPPADHDVAWKQLFDPQGFAGKYGPTTAERRSPRFRFASSDQCTWNGPSWPFATTQTLLALANLLDDGQPQNDVNANDYLRLFSEYVLSQHQRLKSGEVIPWIDEDLDADTDEWIAKDMLIEKNKQVGRGNYYNHSGFADPLLTGLIGLRPQAGDEIVLRPLLPRGAWSYFAVDALPYHGHLLTILYDATGERYGQGRGLILMVDGQQVAARADLGPLNYRMKQGKK